MGVGSGRKGRNLKEDGWSRDMAREAGSGSDGT